MEKKEELYTLISLEDYKAILDIDDDRRDKALKFSLVTATLSIEEYCKRHLLEKKYFEIYELYDEPRVHLNEYPANKIPAVYGMRNRNGVNDCGEIIEPDFYQLYPELKNANAPYTIRFSPAVLRMGYKAVKIVYFAGYKAKKIPTDLRAACLHLAVWYLTNNKSRKADLKESVRKDGEKLEIKMPETVKTLIDSYKRKLI